MKYERLLAEINTLKSTVMEMDRTYRAGRGKYTPVELRDTMKALRSLALSVESGGLDDCFAMDALSEGEL